jgi:hypothetical protein
MPLKKEVESDGTLSMHSFFQRAQGQRELDLLCFSPLCQIFKPPYIIIFAGHNNPLAFKKIDF